MATVINNPKDGSDSSVIGVIMGIILLLVLLGLFVVYALPTIRNSEATPQNGSTDVNITLPSAETPPVSPALTPAPGAPTY